MIKVLHVLSGIGYQGGVQSLIWNYYQYIDTTKIQFDFLVHSNRMDGFEEKFLDRGAKIFYVPPKREGLIKNYNGIKNVIKKGEYDIIHIHQDYLGYIALYAAKKNGISVRIMHSHKANMKESIVKHMYRVIFTKISKSLATDYFACGEEAAQWTYGKKDFERNEVYVLKNAINPDRFIYNQEIREQLRTELGLQGNYVIGNVARFTYQKNHDLLIDIFKEYSNQSDNSKLLLVGSGELYDKIKDKVIRLGLNEQVIFLGERNDVDKLLQAMDLFILTSRFEGLPVTMVEAQTSDLPCVVADNITHEININKRTKYIDLEADVKDWSDKINEFKGYDRRNCLQEVKNAGYDIVTEVDRLISFYENKIDRN